MAQVKVTLNTKSETLTVLTPPNQNGVVRDLTVKYIPVAGLPRSRGGPHLRRGDVCWHPDPPLRARRRPRHSGRRGRDDQVKAICQCCGEEGAALRAPCVWLCDNCVTLAAEVDAPLETLGEEAARGHS